MLGRICGDVPDALERHTYDDDSHSSAAFWQEKRQVYVRARLFALILGGAVVPRLGEITNIEYLKLISEKAERATATSGFVNGTQYLVNVSVFVAAVCVFCYAAYVIKKQTEKYESFSYYINFVQLIVFSCWVQLLSL